MSGSQNDITNIETDPMGMVSSSDTDSKEIKNGNEKMESNNFEEISEMHLTVQFDELVRRSKVLTSGETTEKFLEFVVNAENYRKMWENTELERQRLNIKLDESSQEIDSLESKLEHVRGMLQTETEMRRKIEQDRDSVLRKYKDIQRLVTEDQHLINQASLQEQMLLMSPQPQPQDCHKHRNIMEGISLPQGTNLKGSRHNRSVNRCVEEIKDENLCGRKLYGRKGGVNTVEEEVTHNQMEIHKVEMKTVTSHEATSSSSIKQPRKCISHNHTNHLFEQKMVLKSEICTGCSKRMKFGKIGLKCSVCRMKVHVECVHLVATHCETPVNINSVFGGKQTEMETKSSKRIYASPMLR